MDHQARIDELEARVAELSARLDEPTASRRHLLRLAGAATVGAVAAAATGARHAAADNGLAPTDPNTVTMLNYTGGSISESAFVFQAGTTHVSNASTYPAALAGWSSASANPSSGVYGYSASDTGYGVVGLNDAADGIGVLGQSADGSGVRGTSTTGIGVEAISTSGAGVVAEGATGVMAVGQDYGVVALGAGSDSAGLLGQGLVAGVAGTGGYGLMSRQTTKANVLLWPNNDTGSPNPKTPPPARGDAHAVGELDNVDGDLWWCVGAGTPGTWRKLSGPTTAGAFHAITPARVFDSRDPVPVYGRLAGGSDLVVSIKDARGVDGAVTTADLVPEGATAIAYNLTIAGTLGSGFLSVNPGDATGYTASSINWSAAGQLLANGLVAKIDTQRRVRVFAGGAGSTDFIIDVLGYYR